MSESSNYLIGIMTPLYVLMMRFLWFADWKNKIYSISLSFCQFVCALSTKFLKAAKQFTKR